MFGLIISILVAVLILYKLYSVLGFHDEESTKKKIKEIKALETKLEQAIEKVNNAKEQVKNQELENQIFRKLDETSQNNLTQILQSCPSFNLTWFINHCDFLFTTIFSEVKNKKFQVLEEYSNEPSLLKFKQISDASFNKTLVKINEINIQSISVDENNNAIIKVSISSEQMIEYQNKFPQKTFQSSFDIGAGNIKDGENVKWIILDFADI